MAGEIIKTGEPTPLRKGFFGDGSVDESFSSQKPWQPYIMDTVTFEVLFLQTIPQEISITNELNWVALAASGRNTPLYQYTGGEDSISFNITWYANQAGKQDVLKKVKWLNSISKNNGYDDPPHPILFSFGELFKKSTWIVWAAPYRLSLFDRSLGMLPGLATQDIELRRVSPLNQKRSEMLDLKY